MQESKKISQGMRHGNKALAVLLVMTALLCLVTELGVGVLRARHRKQADRVAN